MVFSQVLFLNCDILTKEKNPGIRTFKEKENMGAGEKQNQHFQSS